MLAIGERLELDEKIHIAPLDIERIAGSGPEQFQTAAPDSGGKAPQFRYDIWRWLGPSEKF